MLVIFLNKLDCYEYFFLKGILQMLFSFTDELHVKMEIFSFRNIEPNNLITRRIAANFHQYAVFYNRLEVVRAA